MKCYCDELKKQNPGYENIHGDIVGAFDGECGTCFDKKNTDYDPDVDRHQLKKDSEEFEEKNIKLERDTPRI